MVLYDFEMRMIDRILFTRHSDAVEASVRFDMNRLYIPRKIRCAPRSGRMRSGVTLMECIFAIGVILTGLVGLAALIPVASQNARDTLEIDRSISESTSAAAKGLVQSFHDLDTLVIFDKPVQGSTTYAGGGYVPSDALQTLEAKLAVAPALKLESPGYVHMNVATGLSSGICIDPFGMPDLALMQSTDSYVTNADTNTPFYAPSATDSAFDYSRFPYFNERYNVLASPNLQINTPGGPVVTLPTVPRPTRPWPMSPRMYRATLKSPMYASTIPIRRFQLLTPVVSRGIFRGNGGLSFVKSNEDGLPRGVLTEPTVIGGSMIDAGRESASDYTWFATITPPFLGGDSFRQSIVVVRKRVMPVPRRLSDPVALQRTNYTIDDAEDNPEAERITWIDPSSAIGFSGGSGGEVTVYGSQGISDQVSTGEWVLLSRQPHIDAVAGAPFVASANGPAVHRWYRVLSAGDAQRTAGFAWAGGTNDVWYRRVSLAGPDWAFQDETSGTNTTPIDDTFCTIVQGAVSVIESEIKFE